METDRTTSTSHGSGQPPEGPGPATGLAAVLFWSAEWECVTTSLPLGVVKGLRGVRGSSITTPLHCTGILGMLANKGGCYFNRRKLGFLLLRTVVDLCP